MPQDQDDIKGADAMKQPPTQGPLLPCPFCGQEPRIRKGVNPYGHCETEDCYANRAQVVSLDVAQQVNAWNLRAPTAPVEASGSGAWADLSCDEQMQLATRIAANVGYVLTREPEHPDSPHNRSPIEPDVEVDDDHLPFEMALDLLCTSTDMAVFSGAGSANVAWVARHAKDRLAALRPQPSGETREAVGRLQLFADGLSVSTVWSADRFDHLTPFDLIRNDLRTVLALLSARPLASGGQHSGGEEWPEAWSGPCTVGNMIANLRTLPPEMPLYTAYHIPMDGEPSLLRVHRPTMSRERVDGITIKTGNESIPYSAVIWTQPQENPFATTPARPEALDEGAAGEPFEPTEHPLYIVSEAARRQLVRAAGWIEKEAYDASGHDDPEDEGLDEAARFLREVFNLSDDGIGR